MSKVLIVCGARVLDASPSARRWAKAELASAVLSFTPDLIAHGDARGPDRWADELAAWLGIPRVVFAIFGGLSDPYVPIVRRPDRSTRPTKDAERFRYDPKDPKGRNAALMAWGAAQRDTGHAVQVCALYAPWTATRGTAHAAGLAREHGLVVTELTASPDLMPDTNDCTGGEG